MAGSIQGRKLLEIGINYVFFVYNSSMCSIEIEETSLRRVSPWKKSDCAIFL